MTNHYCPNVDRVIVCIAEIDMFRWSKYHRAESGVGLGRQSHMLRSHEVSTTAR